MRTLPWFLENIVRHFRIGIRDSIENPIEGDFRALAVAVLAGFDQTLGLPKD